MQLEHSKQLKTKGEQSEPQTIRPSTQIGFDRKFSASKSQPQHPKRVPISSSLLAALNFFNTLGFVSQFPAAILPVARPFQAACPHSCGHSFSAPGPK